MMTAIQVALVKVTTAHSKDNVQALLQVWHSFHVKVTLSFETQGKLGTYPYVIAL